MLNSTSESSTEDVTASRPSLPLPNLSSFASTRHTGTMPAPDFTVFSDENTQSQSGPSFSNSIDYEVFRTTTHRVDDKCNADQTYRLYGLNNVRELIATVANAPKAKNSLRFLLSEKEELLFAREGKPVQSVIPPHYKLTGSSHGQAKCYSAGNFSFRSDGKIHKINHKSGDFRPSFDSLKWVLVLLLKSSLYDSFNATFQLQQLNDRGGVDIRYDVNKADLREQLVELLDRDKVAGILQRNKNHTGHTVVYLADSSAHTQNTKRRASSVDSVRYHDRELRSASQTPVRSRARRSFFDHNARSENVRRRGRSSTGDLSFSARTLFSDNASDASCIASEGFLLGSRRLSSPQSPVPEQRVNSLVATADDATTSEQTPRFMP